MSETTTPEPLSHPDCEACNWQAIQATAEGLDLDLILVRHHGVSYWDELTISSKDGSKWKVVGPFKSSSFVGILAFLHGVKMGRRNQ